MKNLLVILFCIFFFLSCSKIKQLTGSEEKKDDKSATEKTTEKKNDDNKPQGTSGKDDAVKDTKPTGGIEELSYDITSVVAGLKYEGYIVGGAKWRDKNGENVLLITETDIKEDIAKKNEPDMRHKELYAYHYVISSQENKLLWKINDFIKDCPLDLTLSYVKNSLTITDLNNDGVAETTFLYIMACRGDVSPEDMKLMMHEGDTKYAIRGSRKLRLEGETYGGEVNIDKSFNQAPEGFLKYAKEQWNKYQTQKLEE